MYTALHNLEMRDASWAGLQHGNRPGSAPDLVAIRAAAEILCGLSPLPPPQSAAVATSRDAKLLARTASTAFEPMFVVDFHDSVDAHKPSLVWNKQPRLSPTHKEVSPTDKKARASPLVSTVPPCNHCGETQSPQWRKGPGDKPHLCNACGTRYLRKGSLQHSANRRSSFQPRYRSGAITAAMVA